MTNPQVPSGLDVERISGSPLVRERRPDPCSLVIFGGTGDLTARKLVPALYNLALESALPERMAILGVGRRELTTDDYRTRLERHAGEHSRRRPLDARVWEGFAGSIEYVRGDLDDAGLYASLADALERADAQRGTQGNRLFYLATPPSLFPSILARLSEAGLVRRQPPGTAPWQRVIVEKPIGRDLDSARELNGIMSRSMREHQTFRIDHYLGKETVQNILTLRFANAIFEPLWNRTHVAHVEITAAESIGALGRGRFYDETGVVRDIVQNHLLQVLSLCAMEPPASFAADDIRNEKVKVLSSLRPIERHDAARRIAFGQYEGYRDEEGVAPASRTPTYVAMKLLIDNWRWQGVPFYLRAGKELAAKLTEISVHFHTVPLCLFPQESACQRIEPNVLTLRVQPDEGISLRFVSKVPGEDVSVSNVRMHMSYEETFERPIADAYERLLLDGMRGDATLFARRDGVEKAWEFISPILDACEAEGAPSPEIYARGAAGPSAADELIGRDGRRWSPLEAR